MCEIAMDAQKFDEIWLFVEKNVKLPIPTYFKNVLKVCGYNNEISIAAIGDDDIKYMENEVKNGSVTKYFANIDEEKVLEDCTMSAEDFAFTMGHKKWLMTIVDFLKKHLEENGPESFTMEGALKKKPFNKREKHTSKINHLVPTKSSFKVPNASNTQTRRSDCLLDPNENQNEISIADLKIQHGILICKAIMSLINITPQMYAKHMDSIHKKISSDLVIMEIKNKSQKELSVAEFRTASVIEAIICCPLCSQQITVFHESNETNKFLWNTSNFDWHLENVHLNQADNIETKDVQEKDEITRKRAVEEPLKKINNHEVNLTITTKAKARMLEKSMNQTDNIETNIVQEDEIPREIAEKTPLKKISIHDLNNTTTSEAKSLMLGVILSDYKEAKSLELCKSTENIYKKTELISPVPRPVQTYEPTSVFIQKQSRCHDNHNVRPNEKLRPSIVCYSDTSVEDEEQQQKIIHSEIVTGGILQFEQVLNSSSVAKTTCPVEDLQNDDQNIEIITPETGQYVICSLSVKNCSQWPATTRIVKNFVGQVSLKKERTSNRRDLENVQIQLLRKHQHSNRIFHYPVNMELTQVPRKKILKVLQDPLKNRRGEYVFKDKSILDYVF